MIETVSTAPIQILPPEVIERIAAGEIIERPASVVRELLDNALDAGARNVRIDIRGGGMASIRVADDGAGIPADGVEMALRRHATSKIRETADLDDVETLGFRGEALPSIAAVADLTLATATGDSAVGVQLDVAAGSLHRHWVARPRGTTVTVRHLFAALPARLAFVGSSRHESTAIGHLVRRYALAHPDVRFQLTFDGHQSLLTSGRGLATALSEVHGEAVGRALIPLHAERRGEAEWSGYITGRHLTRSTRRHLTVIVNGRCVAGRSLLAAAEEGYRPLLPRGRHPMGVLSLMVPRQAVDVNVHPSKQEVRLRDEDVIAGALRDAVRETLGHQITQLESAEDFTLGPLQVRLPRLRESGPSWDVTPGERLRAARVVGQLTDTLIMLEDASGLYLVDQHRAHERAIYELLRRRHTEGRAGQMLLEPIHIELTPVQSERLQGRLPELAALGFTCEWFGGRSVLVRGVPVIPDLDRLPDLVEDFIETAGGEDDWQHRLLTNVACRAATKRGRPLTIPQMRELIGLLADTDAPAACPHGSPIILQVSKGFLERQFDWS